MIGDIQELSRTSRDTECKLAHELAMRLALLTSRDENHIFLSKNWIYWYRPEMGGSLPTGRKISEFWIEEEHTGGDYLSEGSVVRYYLKIRVGARQPITNRILIKEQRIGMGEEGYLTGIDLIPETRLWLLPFPFEMGVSGDVCHRLDPERVDRNNGKPYVHTVYEPTCQYCHNWLLPGDPRRRSAVRTVDAYYNIAPGQKYCSPECRYKAQLERQKYRYNYSRGNLKKIAPDGWINVRDHIAAGNPSISRIPIDDLPRCDNCGGILQRKRMKRSEGKGQFCSDRCRKAYKRRVEKEAVQAA